MATVLLTWNPGPDDDEIWDARTWRDEMVAPTTAGEVIRSDWSVARHRNGIGPGDRAFLLRQGKHGRGLVAIGVVDSEPEEGPHWDDPSRTTNYVDVTWTRCLPLDDRIRVEDLEAAVPEFNWRAVLSSGRRVPQAAETALDELWHRHVGGSDGVGLPRGNCPRCGSGEVTHLLFGEPVAEMVQALPWWVELAGCDMPADRSDRSCAACGHRWSAGRR